MRCLGRLVLLVLFLVLLGWVWWNRATVRRWLGAPPPAPPLAGHPSPEAQARVTALVARLQSGSADSVRISPNEAASLLAGGANFIPGVAFDSLSFELSDHTVAVRTVIDSVAIPATLRGLIPGRAHHFEELRAWGPLSPVRPGLAEFDAQHVRVHGVPLPHTLIARLLSQASGQHTDSRIRITLPAAVGGFVVWKDGMTLYRSGLRR